MGFNCLACSGIKKVQSNMEDIDRSGSKKIQFKPGLSKGERSWSGNLGPLLAEKSRGEDLFSPLPRIDRKRSKSIMSNYNVIYEDDETMEPPKLARSGGMRRDWSFENLKARAKEMKERMQGNY